MAMPCRRSQPRMALPRTGSKAVEVTGVTEPDYGTPGQPPAGQVPGPGPRLSA